MTVSNDTIFNEQIYVCLFFLPYFSHSKADQRKLQLPLFFFFLSEVREYFGFPASRNQEEQKGDGQKKKQRDPARQSLIHTNTQFICTYCNIQSSIIVEQLIHFFQQFPRVFYFKFFRSQ